MAKNKQYTLRVSLAASLALLCGCISDDVTYDGPAAEYQRMQAEQGPQLRLDTEGAGREDPLGLILPHPDTAVGDIKEVSDAPTGRKVYGLTIEQAITRALANSTDVKVVSFDPEIAKQEITQQAAAFDVTVYTKFDYEEQDNPANSIFESGEANNRTFDTGVKQKTPIGSEWSLSFALTRSWDDLTLSTLSTRHEPVLAFQVRQPLLRDAWTRVNLAGVDISKLNHEISMAVFRQRAEDIAVEVVATYWVLYQARRNLDIQQDLNNRTEETLDRLLSRMEIDATSVQIKQAEASLKAREAALMQAEKLVFDAQDSILRLMADADLNLVENLEVLITSSPNMEPTQYEVEEILAIAMQNNPVIQQRRIALSIADINVEVAKQQKMPRLDLFASARTQSLAGDRSDAFREFDDGDYASYAVGLTLEYPLGNRAREAEMRRRKLERLKAVSGVQNVADQVATGVKEAARSAETNFGEIEVQQAAVEAARIHLTTLEDAEAIRQKLTPEFLLVKLQAQDEYARAQRAEIAAVVDYNISLVRLAQASGTALQLHEIQSAISSVTGGETN